VAPDLFGQPVFLALKDRVDRIYSNRVLPHRGLCITLWDWIEKGEDRLLYSDGAAYTHVAFRMLVYRPVTNEIIIGRIIAADRDGIRLSSDMFSHIYVAPHRLPSPSHFDEAESAWIWTYGQDKLFIDLEELAKCKVVSVTYSETASLDQETDADNHIDDPSSSDKKGASKLHYPPMVINASMAGEGLGVLSWWED